MNDIQNTKIWLAKNKICFVTNSTGLPSSLFLASLKTYIDYIPIQNFWIINGLQNNQPFYGVNAFAQMLGYMLTNDHFDYVIYMDEDCFVTDFEMLINEFKKFKDGEYCMSGIPDGGILCHRNHSRLMVNTFLSFWNIKLLRDKQVKINDIIDYMQTQQKESENSVFKSFLLRLKAKNKDLYSYMNSSAQNVIKQVSKFRKKHFDDNGECPYCEIVRDDPNNTIERYQEPYTYSDEVEVINFEPYYIIEQALVYLTETPIYYMFATDLYDKDFVKDNKQFDLSGLSSAVYNYNNSKDYTMIAVHTWYSRAYTKWPSIPIQLEQTKRINTIIREFSKI